MVLCFGTALKSQLQWSGEGAGEDDLERCLAALEGDSDRDVRYYVGVATDTPVPLTPGATTGQIAPEASPPNVEEAAEKISSDAELAPQDAIDESTQPEYLSAATTEGQDASAPIALPAETSAEAGQVSGDGSGDEDQTGATADVDDVDESEATEAEPAAEPCPEVEGADDDQSTSAPAIVDVAGAEPAPLEAVEGGDDRTPES